MKPRVTRHHPVPTCLAIFLLSLNSVWAPPIIVDETTCTLIDAVIAANTDAPSGGCPAGSGADTIELVVDVQLTAPYAGDHGLPTVTSDLTIEGHGFKIERSPQAPPFELLESQATLVMNEVALLNGGVLVEAPLTLINSTISAASDCALEISYTTGLLIDSAVIDSYWGICGLGTRELRNSVVSGNTIGIKTPGSGNTFLFNSAVSDNLSAGIQTHNDEYVFLQNSTVSGNGYGIAAAITSVVKVQDSTVSENAETGIAAGIGSRVILIRSTVSGNGGHGVDVTNDATAELVNSTISANAGVGLRSSGGIYPTPSFVRQSTIWGNQIGLQGTNSNAGFIVSGSIVATNTDGDCVLSGGAVVNSWGGNFAGDLSCGAEFATITGVDPVLADNGGPTRTHALIPGSTAIDGGDSWADPCPETDQRGLPRGDDACDSGSFEFQCSITVEREGTETRIWFSPSTSGFDVVSGLLSELVRGEGFDAATCLGAVPSSPAVDGLPAPPPGDGRYYLARGRTDCVGAGYGKSSLDPDPRDQIDPGPCS